MGEAEKIIEGFNPQASSNFYAYNIITFSVSTEYTITRYWWKAVKGREVFRVNGIQNVCVHEHAFS